MQEVDVNLQTTGLHRLYTDTDGPVQQYLRNMARRIETIAKAKAPVGETGALKASIKVRQETGPNGTVFFVGSSLPYAGFVHRGTPRNAPGTYIYAKDAPVMAFNWKGQRVAFLKVHGHKPNPFLLEALEEVVGKGSGQV